MTATVAALYVDAKGRDQRSRTPPAFRDVLLAMARSAAQVPA